jgi:uncharacterized protein (DUF1800 family)
MIPTGFGRSAKSLPGSKAFPWWLAVALLAAVATPSAIAKKDPKEPKPNYSAFKHKLAKDDQLLHVANRLTYGARPQDLDQVKMLGVKKWMDLQLHPERIAENPELARHLEPLESLRLSQADAARQYPNPQLIRAIAAGREPMPEDPVTRAAIQRLMQRVKLAQAAGKAGAPGNQTANQANANDNRPLEPAVPLDSILTRDQIRRLRMGSVEQRREILASVPEDKLDDLAIALPPGLRPQLLAAASPVLRRKMMLMTAPQQLIAFDLSEGKLYRAIYSNRQLEEQLVDFWFNHFNVFLEKGADRFLVPSYEREAIRPNVLGHFRTLLEATATSPAMLFYLDNWQSVAADTRRGRGNRPARGLNENYARELMELHTLGVDGGYTQKDVTEVARCFTGWTIRAPREGGGFWFNEKVHDKGEKIVLGVKIPAGGGKEDGEKVLDLLAKHPATARFISTKLAQRFVADEPPPALIDHMAKTFQKTNGDIREVLRVMLTSNEFLSAGARKSKVKSPFEMVVSAVRASGANVDYAFPLANRIAQMGQPLYRKLEPTGYSNVGSEWMSTSGLLARMNFALALAQNQVPGSKVDPAAWSSDTADVARRLLLSNAAPETLAAISKSLEVKANPAAMSVDPPDQPAAKPMEKPSDRPSGPGAIAGLVLGSPEFQKR